MPTQVHLEEKWIEGAKYPALIGRVYYGNSGFAEKVPFDAMFVVFINGGGRAETVGAHGKISVRAYGITARMLLDQYGIKYVDMTRHGRDIEIDTARASGFGDL
jgi:hypothetical protein